MIVEELLCQSHCQPGPLQPGFGDCREVIAICSQSAVIAIAITDCNRGCDLGCGNHRDGNLIAPRRNRDQAVTIDCTDCENLDVP